MILAQVLLTSCANDRKAEQTLGLKDAFAEKFYVGTALNEKQIIGNDTAVISVVLDQFNAIVAENCMKSESLQPAQGVFDFSLADRFVNFGEQHNLFVTGHCLVWHSQVPDWFFTDSLGNEVSREVLIDRIKTHITTVVSRYKGRVKGWDVVNEAILDDGSFRKSKFYNIIGEDFIKLAFEFAHAADPDAELYYNDFSMAIPEKRKGIVSMVQKLQQQNVPIDGIGMQSHVGLNFPNIQDYENSLLSFAALGVKVMITELDITVLPNPQRGTGADVSDHFEYQTKLNPYAEALPDSVSAEFDARYLEYFKLYLKHQDKISRVTFWGVTDAHSWRNNWPVNGRKDYPLLFDRNNKAKKVVQKIITLAQDETDTVK